MAAFDVLGLGAVAVDDLLYVDAYPPADTKTMVKRRDRQGGGQTGTALVAAARVGARCAYAGVLGDDEFSRFVLSNFDRQGVDVRHVLRRPDARPIHSTVIVDEARHTRSIFFELGGPVGAGSDWPPDEVLRSTRVLFVDHYGIEGMIRAARLARRAGIPVVADLERDDWPGFDELLDLVDHLILSRDFAARRTGAAHPADEVRRLWSLERQVVVVTCGDQGCWYRNADGPAEPRHQPAFAVPVVDTTGCGDVFHGAYAAALAWRMDLPERIRFATAAAALKAMQAGGQAGIPSRAAVDTFLQQRKGDSI